MINFKEILIELHKKIHEDIFKTTQFLIEKTGIIRKLKENLNTENINRIENIGELFNSIKIFSLNKTNNSLNDFINEVALDENIDEENEKNTEYVSLMTIHQSKGLEFKYIYIVGLENGLFPSQRSMKIQADIEEERRLFYVAITRAIKKVYISYALNRFKFGTIINSTKSLFIEEIEHHLDLENDSLKYSNWTKKQNILLAKTNKRNKSPNNIHEGNKAFYSVKIKHPNKKLTKIRKEIYRDNRNLKLGQKIRHNIFGLGEITKIDLSDGNEKINVTFKHAGEKILLTKFAKFEIIK